MTSNRFLFLYIITLQIIIHGCSRLYKISTMETSFSDAKRRTKRICCSCDDYCGFWGTDCCRGCRRCSESCFPSNVKVILENGTFGMMSELQIGDKVQTSTPDGKTTFSEIKAFLPKEHTAVNMNKQITTSSNQTISLTGNHLIYVRKRLTDYFLPLYADNVVPGDEVLVPQNDELIPTKVINVSNIKLQGAFGPLTQEGYIVVNGVLASCYGSFHHDLAHTIMTPMQWYPKVIEWFFGVENRSPGYVDIMKQLGRSMLPTGLNNIWG